MASRLPKSLLKGAYMAGDDPAPNRLILAIDGADKSGKTNFCLSAPKPLVYLDFDLGKEGTIEKQLADNPLIVTSEPFAFQPTEVSWGEERQDARERKIMEAADRELNRFREMYLDSLRTAVVQVEDMELPARTVVIDTGGEAWELLRHCEFGRLTQIKPHHYGAVNGLMRDLVRAGLKSSVNVIWAHKLKNEWNENSEGKARKSGVYERQGFKDMSFLVQGNLLAYRVPPTEKEPVTVRWRAGEMILPLVFEGREDPEVDLGFRLGFGSVRQNPSLEGSSLKNEAITFQEVAQLIRPDVDPAEWLSTEV